MWNLFAENSGLRKQFLAPLGFPTIVCLCGSTRFFDTFHRINLEETLAGKIVLSIGCDTKSDQDLIEAIASGEITGSKWPMGAKEKLDWLHLRKIELANVVDILNVGGYIGESTSRELQYARELHKSIYWLEQSDLMRPDERLYR